MAKIASIIICATPRSGSTLLCGLLADTGIAGRPESWYRRQNIADWARQWGVAGEHAAFERAYLAAVRRAGSGAGGIFGLRLMWGTVPELRKRLMLLYPDAAADASLFERAFGAPLYLCLSRQDKVAQAVSRLRAEQTGLWHLGKNGTEYRSAEASGAEHYDASALERLLEEVRADEAAWDDWFGRQGIEPFALTYEALTAAPQKWLADILEAAGADTAFASHIESKTVRMADATSRDWAERFRQERPAA
jgi:LPS sulfotransferase NodH